jgi:hypothetical protein
LRSLCSGFSIRENRLSGSKSRASTGSRTEPGAVRPLIDFEV